VAKTSTTSVKRTGSDTLNQSTPHQARTERAQMVGTAIRQPRIVTRSAKQNQVFFARS